MRQVVSQQRLAPMQQRQREIKKLILEQQLLATRPTPADLTPQRLVEMPRLLKKNAIALGYKSSSIGPNSTALGHKAEAKGGQSIAIGRGAVAEKIWKQPH